MVDAENIAVGTWTRVSQTVAYSQVPFVEDDAYRERNHAGM